VVEDKTLAFVITTHDVNVIELPAATADHVLTALRDLYAWRNLEQPHPKPLRQLYQWLVEPLAAHINTPHLTIVPHSLLHYVPFAAITDGREYFGAQHTLSLLPSASLLPFLTQNVQRAGANPSPHAVVFGNPTTTALDLPPLAYAASEAQAIASLLGTTVYTATAASETQLRTSAADARIIHLAAHGGYNPFNPLYSLIALADDKEQDGRLETHEIFGLSLQRNDLVVLSACQTTVGDLSRGDDIVGLTRAFFFAGTPTVIASLWSVDDAATETLMVAFYKHWLQGGMSKAQALQTAQADVRADPRWTSPFYWAGFVLNGHPGYNTAKAAPK
jgi:CHAT domain-containing protein